MQIDKPSARELEGRVFAVDGDIIAYRTAAVCEEQFEGTCESIINTTLSNIATDTGVENMRIYISGEKNFRYDVAKTLPYKGNRTSFVKPRFLNHCKEYLVEKYRAIRAHGYEADDAIATDMTLYNAIHCGIDKDMFQIAGLHYNWVKKEWYLISEDEATLNLYRQICMGDKSDNIPGLPRIGEKKAEQAIYDPATALKDTLLLYEATCAEKLPDVNYKEYFAEQSRLISMVRDIDFMSCITTYVEANTDGFSSEDGDFNADDVEAPEPSTDRIRPNVKL